MNTFSIAKWAKIDFRNIKRINSAVGIDPTNMHVCSLPNVEYADSYPKGRSAWSGVNGSSNDTNTAFYMPKLQELGIIACGWYNRGVIRWFIIGTQCNSIVTITENIYLVNVLTKPDFKGFFVPDNLVDTYKADSKWGSVSSLIFPISNFESITGETVPTE